MVGVNLQGNNRAYRLETNIKHNYYYKHPIVTTQAMQTYTNEQVGVNLSHIRYSDTNRFNYHLIVFRRHTDLIHTR